MTTRTAMHRRPGFSLVELVIVIVIIGIIAAIAVPRFSKATEGADKKTTKSSLIIFQNAISLYGAEHDHLPGWTNGSKDSPSADATNLEAQLTGQTTKTGALGGTLGPYLREIPKNPLNSNSDVIKQLDAGPAAAADCTTNGWVYEAQTGTIVACEDDGGTKAVWDEAF